MSGLRDRLKRATERATECAFTEGDAVVVPYDCIRDYLEDHSLVQLMGLSTRDLHSALLHVERINGGNHDATGAPESDSAPSKRPYDCPECSAGYLLLHAHEGHYACENCGVIPHRGTINVEREWIDGVCASDLSVQRRRRVRGVPGVPRWMVDRCSSGTDSSRGAYERASLADMENLNGYMNLSPDLLHAAHRSFLRWMENGYTRELKMVACMFHVVLRPQFLPDAQVRDMVRKRRRVPQVEDPTPKPEFACRCGEMHHTKKEARFHACRSR